MSCARHAQIYLYKLAAATVHWHRESHFCLFIRHRMNNLDVVEKKKYVRVETVSNKFLQTGIAVMVMLSGHDRKITHANKQYSKLILHVKDSTKRHKVWVMDLHTADIMHASRHYGWGIKIQFHAIIKVGTEDQKSKWNVHLFVTAMFLRAAILHFSYGYSMDLSRLLDVQTPRSAGRGTCINRNNIAVHMDLRRRRSVYILNLTGRRG